MSIDQQSSSLPSRDFFDIPMNDDNDSELEDSDLEEIVTWPPDSDSNSDFERDNPDSADGDESLSDAGIFSGDSHMDESTDTLMEKIGNSVPVVVKELRESLRRNYKCSSSPPDEHQIRPLAECEKLSLRHYTAWQRSNGTVKAYKLHAEVLQSITNLEVYSLHRVRKLARSLTSFSERKIDMCPRSCIAYTGEYQNLQKCPYVHKKHGLCNEARFQKTPSGKFKPRAQVGILPVMDTFKAMFSSADSSYALQYRDRALKHALHLTGSALYSDYGNSGIHKIQHQKMGLFQDPRDIALALSTDGAQLTMKKQSNTWILILIILNLPPDIRYKSNNIIINLAIPGPNSPGDIESFLVPLFQEMAEASEGIWMRDAIYESQYFKNRTWIVMVLGDMLGAAKINGMSGHSAIFGDRFSTIQGARNSLSPGAKAQYYPIKPPQNEIYNPTRPESYDLNNLPMRTHQQYWETIEKLNDAANKTQRTAISKATGVSKLPLAAASGAFIHPSFSPLDPFHLFYENIAAFKWDLMVKFSQKDEIVHIPDSKACLFGQYVAQANKTLPPGFCGTIRDPYLKRQSQYKVYEWMALLHWFMIPMGIELGFNPSALKNLSELVFIIEYAMKCVKRSEKDLEGLHKQIQKYLHGFEALYIADDPEKINRARLCIFQLIHVPIHIRWNGSIRISSQATVERTIGALGHKIRSRKSPFSNLANIVYESELIRILSLYYPDIDVKNFDSIQRPVVHQTKLTQKLRTTKKDKLPGSDALTHLEILRTWYLKAYPIFSVDVFDNSEVSQYGRLKLSNGRTLRSYIGDTHGTPPNRLSRWFEVRFLYI